MLDKIYYFISLIPSISSDSKIFYLIVSLFRSNCTLILSLLIKFLWTLEKSKFLLIPQCKKLLIINFLSNYYNESIIIFIISLSLNPFMLFFIVNLSLSVYSKNSTYFFFILSFIGLFILTSRGYNIGVNPGGITKNNTYLL